MRKICSWAIVYALLVPGIAAANTLHSQISSGQDAPPGEQPGVVYLQSGGRAFCSGALIAPRYVVTAAHCLYAFKGQSAAQLKVQRLVVRFANMPGRPVLSVVRADSWGGFEPAGAGGYADVGIAQLDRLAPVVPLGLAALSGQSSFVALGYGMQAEGQQMSPNLSRISMSLQSSEQCSAFVLGELVRTVNKRWEFCAAAQGGPCPGDSGGPILDRRGQIVGLTSWGPDPVCRPDLGRKAVFARVFAAQRWLRYQTGAALFDLPALRQVLHTPRILSVRFAKKTGSLRAIARLADNPGPRLTWSGTLSLFVSDRSGVVADFADCKISHQNQSCKLPREWSARGISISGDYSARVFNALDNSSPLYSRSFKLPANR